MGAESGVKLGEAGGAGLIHTFYPNPDTAGLLRGAELKP